MIQRYCHLRCQTTSYRGFTLVEVLVTVIIFGILIAIAVPTFLTSRYRAEATRGKATILLVKKLIDDCLINNEDLKTCTDWKRVIQEEPSLASTLISENDSDDPDTQNKAFIRKLTSSSDDTTIVGYIVYFTLFQDSNNLLRRARMVYIMAETDGYWTVTNPNTGKDQKINLPPGESRVCTAYNGWWPLNDLAGRYCSGPPLQTTSNLEGDSGAQYGVVWNTW